MDNRLNGWGFIDKWLKLQGKTQKDLAALLGVTSSAVSQMKRGTIVLNSRQVKTIVNFLNMDEADSRGFYSELFHARLNEKNSSRPRLAAWHDELFFNLKFYQSISGEWQLKESGAGKDDEALPVAGDELRAAPIISFAQAAGYEPAAEPFDDFARGCSDETACFSELQDGYFALRVEGDSMTPEFPHGTILLVAGGSYPQRGDVVVAKLRSGQVVVKHYSRKDNVIFLDSENPDGKSFSWHCKEDSGFVQWMYPVLEATMNLRDRRWERRRKGG